MKGWAKLFLKNNPGIIFIKVTYFKFQKTSEEIWFGKYVWNAI